jgi:hypothetical protein
MNKVGAVDMRYCLNATKFNEAGFPRNNNWFFRQLLQRNPEWFSADNRAAILGSRPRTPVVDDTWAAAFPEHAAYLNKPLVHHHILQGPVAVPVPRPIHVAWTRALHPGVPDVITAPSLSSGVAAGEIETLTSADYEDDDF